MNLKKFFFLCAFLFLSGVASAQYGTYMYQPNAGVWVPPPRVGVPVIPVQQPVIVVNPAPQQPVIPMQMVTTASPGVFSSGGSYYRCSAIRQVAGGLLGALGGWAIGKNITLNGHHLNTGGAIAGTMLGAEVACEMVGPTQVGTPAGQVTLNASAQQVAVPAGSRLTYSNESTGADSCRALSDGTLVLKDGTSTQHGQVIATESQYPKQQGEDCNHWRRRVAPMVVR